MSKENITIHDIAREAGVSVATVSRVLNDTANVSDDKKNKVNSLIKKYEYKPNDLARSFHVQKTKTIGVVVPDIRNAFYSTLFVECEKVAANHGYSMILCNAMNDNIAEITYLESLSQKRVDAIIEIGGNVDEVIPNPEYVSKVNKITKLTPIITTNCVKGADCYSIVTEEKCGMDRMMEYLLSLGHKKIALIGGYKNNIPSYTKEKVFRAIMKENDLPIEEKFIMQADYSTEGGYNSMREILSLSYLPTAVIAMNDSIGIGIINAANENGLHVPKDLSVASFDDTLIAQMSMPKLTAVGYNYVKYAEEIMEMILNIEKGIENRVKVVPMILMKRASCTVAKK